MRASCHLQIGSSSVRRGGAWRQPPASRAVDRAQIAGADVMENTGRTRGELPLCNRSRSASPRLVAAGRGEASIDEAMSRHARRTAPARCARPACGLEITVDRRPGDTDPRRSRRRVQPRLHLPEGIDAQAAPRGPRPPAHAAGAPRRRARRPRRGTRRSPRSSAAWRRSSRRHGRDAVAVYLGNPNAHSLAGMLYGKALIKAIGSTQRLHGEHRRPAPQGAVGGADVRRRLDRARARRRPHRLLADARRQPLRVERQPGDGTRLAGAHRGAAGPRRQARRRRPAAQPHGRGGRRVDRRASRAATRSSSPRWCASCSTRTSSTSATWRRTSRASIASVRRWPPFGPDEVADVTGVDAATIRRLARELAAAPRAAVYGRIGTTTAEFGTVASWLVDVLNICTGNLDRPGGAMFTTPAVGGANTHGTPRVGRGVRPNHPRSRVRDLARHVRRAPRRLPRRGDRDAGTGSDPGAGVRRRQPGAVAAQRRAPRRRPGVARADGVRRHLPQRDVTARRRDPPGAVGAGEGALRRRPAAAGGAQRRQLVGRRCCRCPTASPTSGRSSPASPSSPRAPGPAADPAVVDDLVIGSLVDAAVGDEHGPLHGRAADELLAALAAANRSGADRRLLRCAAARTATTSAANPRTGSPSTP